MRVGVLALQGDFHEHQSMLEAAGAEVLQVRLPQHLDGLAGLVIPGGESTTIGKLAVAYGLIDAIRNFGENHAVWGTCAGAIFLSKDAHRQQPLLEMMDITVERNAFGRQISSFEADLTVPVLVNGNEQPFHAVFIRAPLIESVGKACEVLAKLEDGRIVAARQNNLLATSFHPELTGDNRFHGYFLEMAK